MHLPRSTSLVSVILLLSLWIGGCASKDRSALYLPDPITSDMLGETEAEGKINPERYCVVIDGVFKPCLYSFAADFRLDSESQKAQRRVARNLLQCKLMALSDDAVDRHFNDVFTNQDATNLLLGMAAIGSGTAGALATGGSSQAFSAVAASLLGTKALISDEIYADNLPQVLLKRVMAERKQLAEVLSLARERPIDDYTVADAVRDALAYHGAGSFQHALSLLVQDSQRAASFDDDLARIAKIKTARGDLAGASRVLESAVTQTPYSTEIADRTAPSSADSWKAWTELHGREAAAQSLLRVVDELPADSALLEDVLGRASELVRSRYPQARTRAKIFDAPQLQTNAFSTTDLSKFRSYLLGYATSSDIAELLSMPSLGVTPATSGGEGGTEELNPARR